MYTSHLNDTTEPHSVLGGKKKKQIKGDYFCVSTRASPFSAIEWMQRCVTGSHSRV